MTRNSAGISPRCAPRRATAARRGETLARTRRGDRDRRRGPRVRAGRPRSRPARGVVHASGGARLGAHARPVRGRDDAPPVRARGRSAEPVTRRSSCSARRMAAGRRRPPRDRPARRWRRAAARRRDDRRRPRRGPAGDPPTPTQLFTRAPGAAFTAAPDPGAALEADEQLVGGDAATATARTLLAVIGGDSRPRSSRRRPPTARAAPSCAWTPTAGTASRSTRPSRSGPSRWPPPGPRERGCSRRPATASSSCAATRPRRAGLRRALRRRAPGRGFEGRGRRRLPPTRSQPPPTASGSICA